MQLIMVFDSLQPLRGKGYQACSSGRINRLFDRWRHPSVHLPLIGTPLPVSGGIMAEVVMGDASWRTVSYTRVCTASRVERTCITIIVFDEDWLRTKRMAGAAPRATGRSARLVKVTNLGIREALWRSKVENNLMPLNGTKTRA